MLIPRDTRIHMVPEAHKNLLNVSALCGSSWEFIADNPKRVTCPECLKIMLEKDAKEVTR